MNRKDLVLLGGGHTHVLLIKALAMRPITGVRVTLVSEKSLTPYSGMLPGFVAGHYSLAQTNIDLNALCRKSNVRWIQARCGAIDADKKRLGLSGQPGLEFDVLSVDIGSTPDQRIAGAGQYAVGVKPIAGFQQRWQDLLIDLKISDLQADPEQAITAQKSATSQQLDWGVVGAGAGGVELVLAMAHRLRHQTEIRFHLIFRSERILTGYPRRIIQRVERALKKHNIQLHSGFPVNQVTASGVTNNAGEQIALDTSVWCTGALGAPWLPDSMLATTDKNFIEVGPSLQSISHKHVFAVGDIAANIDDPRPKAGVFAVRQAPYLEENLRRFFAGEALQVVDLQTQYLSLLALGEQVAVASRNGLALSGSWVWKWKDYIDQKFMRQFVEMQMVKMQAEPSSADDVNELMHCGGCASKLGPGLLADNLARVGSDQVEDAVLWQATPGSWSVQSIDGFRSFMSDESRFAQICVNHALSDLYAMGATPIHAQVWVNLAFNHARLQQRDHLRVLQAIQTVLSEQNTRLSGGHSSEGVETHIGIVANGEVDLGAQWSKAGSHVGDAIVISKPLGTGVIMAANMQAQASAESVDAATESMLSSNASAMAALLEHCPTAVTDVTGFGLIGHLLEMLDSNKQRLVARLDLVAIPLLPGALELAASGWRSSLYPQLEPYLARCDIDPKPQAARKHKNRSAAIELLLDPQTSGGLLATLAHDDAKRLMQQSNQFVCIGTVLQAEGNASNKINIQL
ncbi:MAG: selenide,water dikinase [Polaribacter sp.]|jgi:selenide,water dikinase